MESGHPSSPDVVLALMPFAPVTHPSLALGCLAGSLAQGGIQSRGRYFTLDFAMLLGPRELHAISNHLVFELLGEWIFSQAAFPGFDSDAYPESFAAGVDRKLLLRARSLAPPFIDAAAREVAAMRPKIIGASSMFNQNCASLALLRRVRELEPRIVTVMGGANCEGEMGRAVHRNFPWVDYVFSGEADTVFPEFCRRILAGERVGERGVWTADCIAAPADREDAHPGKLGRGIVEDLSDLPDPLFDDYFTDLDRTGAGRLLKPGLLLETSRGCWWGERRPCAFCGLNGLSRKHRQKKPEAAHGQITRLAARHGVSEMQMTDNIIGAEHIERLIPRFADGGMNFLYEVSPTLSRETIRNLADAGVRWMQPGIEHLHGGALSALGKANRPHQNIRFLKWAREYGVTLFWNFLFCFPGEEESWFARTAELVPKIVHLQPPMSLPAIRYDRFSRYHAEPGRYGLSLQPYPAYAAVYPLPAGELADLAYYFDDRNRRTDAPFSPGMILLLERIGEWRRLFHVAGQTMSTEGAQRPRPVLGMSRIGPDAIRIEDTRPIARVRSMELSGMDAAVYGLCDAGSTRAALAVRLREKGIDPAKAENVIARLTDAGIMLDVEGRPLSLAVNLPCREYAPHDVRPGGHWLRRRPPPDPAAITVEQAYRTEW